MGKTVWDSQKHVPHITSWEYFCCEKLGAPVSPHLSPHSLNPRPLSCPSHTHKATSCLLSASFMVGTLFSLSSLLPFLLWSININSTKFHLAPGLFCSHQGQPVYDLQLLSLLPNLCSLSLIPTSSKNSDTLPEPHCSPGSHTVFLFWRRRVPAERLQLLGSIYMNKQLWKVQLKLLCKHSPKYVLHCIIPSNKDSGIRIWLSVLLMLHGVQ